MWTDYNTAYMIHNAGRENVMSSDAIEQLMQSPQLPRHIERLQDALAEERRRRQAFYQDITEDDKAEFINDEVLFQSPAKLRHVDVTDSLAMLLKAFLRVHPVGFVGTEKMLVSLTRNDYEPDICFFRKDKSAQFDGDQMQFPAPDLIVEVLSPSTEQRARGVKFNDYAAHAVGEYWLIDAEEQSVEQYVLRGEAYNLLLKARTGTIASSVVAGFEIPIRAIFDGDENLAALRQIVAP